MGDDKKVEDVEDFSYPREGKYFVEVIFMDEPNLDTVNYLLLWILNFGVFIIIPIIVAIVLIVILACDKCKAILKKENHAEKEKKVQILGD